jgi:hypothetical protein
MPQIAKTVQRPLRADRCKYHEALANDASGLGAARLGSTSRTGSSGAIDQAAAPSMKEYRLLAWPELPAEYRRTAHRRALSEMSQRFMSLAKLVEVSGLKKSEIRAFIEMLDGRAVIAERDTTVPDSFFDSISPLGWLRRAMNSNHDRR